MSHFYAITWVKNNTHNDENNYTYYSNNYVQTHFQPTLTYNLSKFFRILKYSSKEILRLKEDGYTKREIGENLGFSYEQIHNFISRYNEKQRRITAGVALKRKGRPPKEYVVSEQDKVAELKYILVRKEAKIKALEIENELMRDFLSLTGRKWEQL